MNKVIHTVAHCTECNWSSESYLNAKSLAMQHAKIHKHYVEGEQAVSFSYGSPAAERAR